MYRARIKITPVAGATPRQGRLSWGSVSTCSAAQTAGRPGVAGDLDLKQHLFARGFLVPVKGMLPCPPLPVPSGVVPSKLRPRLPDVPTPNSQTYRGRDVNRDQERLATIFAEYHVPCLVSEVSNASIFVLMSYLYIVPISSMLTCSRVRLLAGRSHPPWATPYPLALDSLTKLGARQRSCQ